VLPEARVKVPICSAPDALSAVTSRARSISPGLMLLPHPVSDEVHGPMKGRRNNDDGQEAEERVPLVESRDRPRRDREAEEQSADDEIVLVEERRLGAARFVHPPLDERPSEVSEEGAE